jgi:hypothetical protein
LRKQSYRVSNSGFALKADSRPQVLPALYQNGTRKNSPASLELKAFLESIFSKLESSSATKQKDSLLDIDTFRRKSHGESKGEKMKKLLCFSK